MTYENGMYTAAPCGAEMILCNNAFFNLADRMEDLLSTSFNESPRGDKKRVGKVANNLL